MSWPGRNAICICDIFTCHSSFWLWKIICYTDFYNLLRSSTNIFFTRFTITWFVNLIKCRIVCNCASCISSFIFIDDFKCLWAGQTRNSWKGVWDSEETAGISWWNSCYWGIQIYSTWGWFTWYGILHLPLNVFFWNISRTSSSPSDIRSFPLDCWLWMHMNFLVLCF